MSIQGTSDREPGHTRRCPPMHLRCLFLLACLFLLIAGTFVTTVLLPPFTQAAEKAPSAPVCQGQQCDNVDPYGWCQKAKKEGGCQAPATFTRHQNAPAASDSCIASGSWGTVPLGEAPQALLDITTDGTSGGQLLGRMMLAYSYVCKTNWLMISPLGICVSAENTPICSVEGTLSRPASADGPARTVWIIDPQLRPLYQNRPEQLLGAKSMTLTNPAMNRTAMLYAPNTPVQGCIRITLPTSNIKSPLSCLTQTGFSMSGESL